MLKLKRDTLISKLKVKKFIFINIIFTLNLTCGGAAIVVIIFPCGFNNNLKKKINHVLIEFIIESVALNLLAQIEYTILKNTNNIKGNSVSLMLNF